MSGSLPKPDAVYSSPGGGWEAYWGDDRAAAWTDFRQTPSGVIRQVWRWHAHRCGKMGPRGIAETKLEAIAAAKQAMVEVLKGEA